MTGEVVGQVASQTLENLTSINSVVTMPVLRPLVGMDKDEITAEAQRLGTYPISIIPDQDCCTLFTPRHPATKARRADVERRGSRRCPIDEIVDARSARPPSRVRSREDLSSFPADKMRARSEREHRENHTRQARGHEGGFERPRRDRRRGHGPARIAEEGARQGEGRRRRRPRDGGVQVARHRGADAARERDPARSRVGPARQQAAREERRACCWRTRRPATTPTTPGRLPRSARRTGRCAG